MYYRRFIFHSFCKEDVKRYCKRKGMRLTEFTFQSFPIDIIIRHFPLNNEKSGTNFQKLIKKESQDFLDS